MIGSFMDIISRKKEGVLPTLARGGLRISSLFYGILVNARNLAYDKQWKQVHKVPLPVISVGNLTTGGSGKTPFVEFLCRYLLDHKQTPLILSRGYKSLKNQKNDEALVLEKNLPNVAHLSHKDRVYIAQKAISQFQPSCLVLDDGFQHRRLHRDLDILLIDSLCPFGYGYLLPRGLLREPLRNLKRADLICITRANQTNPKEIQRIYYEIHKWSEVPILETSLSVSKIEKKMGNRFYPFSREEKGGAKVLAFCGLGNPRSFQKTLEALKFETVGFYTFPDHYHYTEKDIQKLEEKAHSLGASFLVTTQKDSVKITSHELPLLVISINMTLEKGKEVLEEKIRSLFS